MLKAQNIKRIGNIKLLSLILNVHLLNYPCDNIIWNVSFSVKEKISLLDMDRVEFYKKINQSLYHILFLVRKMSLRIVFFHLDILVYKF